MEAAAPFTTIPGFRWLARTKVNLFVLLLGSSVLWLTVYWLVGAFGALFPPAGGTLSIVFTALFCVSIGSWIHQVRASQEDLEQLASTGDWAPTPRSLSKLNGSARDNTVISVVGALLGIALYVFGRVVGDSSDTLTAISQMFTEIVFFSVSPRILIWNYLSLTQFVFIGIALLHSVISHFRRANLFIQLAKSIPIDLLQTGKLTPIANPLMRGLMAPVVVLAASGPLFFANNGQMQDSFYLVSLPVSFMLLLLTFSSCNAVLVIHRRIQAQKKQEIDLIQRFLDGDEKAMYGSRLGSLQSQFTATEVLSYRDWVESIWEWPLHGQLPRIAFYLIIPPMAWAAAALVEQLVDAALT